MQCRHRECCRRRAYWHEDSWSKIRGQHDLGRFRNGVLCRIFEPCREDVFSYSRKQLKDGRKFTYVPAPITAAAPESVDLLTGASPRGTAVQLRTTAIIRRIRTVKEVKTDIVTSPSFSVLCERA